MVLETVAVLLVAIPELLAYDKDSFCSDLDGLGARHYLAAHLSMLTRLSCSKCVRNVWGASPRQLPD